MNNNVCPKMNGAKCAGDWCDFWDHEKQECSEATESKMRCEMMELVLERLKELLYQTKDKEDVMRIAREMNIVPSGTTKH